MNALHTLVILLAAFLAVYATSALAGLRNVLGAQIDLLPSLIVYVSLNCNITVLALSAVVGGLCFDALSANPFGVTVLPLFLSGFIIHRSRALVMREQDYAQFLLGLGASAGTPVMTLLLLYTLGETPLIGWGSLWQFLVMSLGGAVITPLWCRLFDFVHRLIDYVPLTGTSFRSDREIKRGR